MSADSDSDAASASLVGLSCARCRRPLRIPNHKPPQPDPRGRVWVAIRRWPEGWICSGCFAKACETYGDCDLCGVDRLLPGIGPSGRRRCTDCAGGLGDFRCSRCDEEGWLHYRGVCGRCVLKDRLAAALDDGTGRVRPELIPLFDLVVGMERPRSGILWLTKPHVPPILTALAHGHVPLTHDGVATLSPWRSAIYVRDLMVAAGILPAVDRFLFLFERWLPGWLDQVPDSGHRKILHAFATWHVLRGLRAAAATGPIGHYREQIARRQLRLAARFLEHLAHRGIDLADCRQGELDQWLAQANNPDNQQLRSFLRWAIKGRRMPRLQLPPHRQAVPAPISSRQRIELIRRIHNDTDMDSVDRVAALLVLLYAQSLGRVTRLTIDDITVVDGQMLIALGDPPAPVPAPFDVLISQYVAARPNLTTATNRDSRWLFPGRRAGQPLHPTTIRLRFQQHGIPNLNGRTRAFREMLLQAPPSVVAGMLGYGTNRAEALAAEAGSTWKHYAAGDHGARVAPQLPR